MTQVIDSKGYRLNVGIILANDAGRVFWARRAGQQAWQFPQGGIRRNEQPVEAMYRELAEETGLQPHQVELMGQTREWLYYQLPARYIRRRSYPVCIGQKQCWFMLRLIADDRHVDVAATDQPEFDDWCWVDYWQPPQEVIFFKRAVYRRALRELEPLLLSAHAAKQAAAAARG